MSVYTPAALAREWDCSERHIRNLIAAGQLRGFRLAASYCVYPQKPRRSSCMPDYRIGRLNGRLCLTWWAAGKRHRYSLGTSDPSEAERIAPSLYAELTRPKGKSIEELWQAYAEDRGRACCLRNNGSHLESSTSSLCRRGWRSPSRSPTAVLIRRATRRWYP